MELAKKLKKILYPRTNKKNLIYGTSDEFCKSITIVCNELRKDQSEGSYYHAWQANIAMAFYDEMKDYCEKNHIALYVDLHKISNDAAKNFLNLLIR
jgi:hypothetical protein